MAQTPALFVQDNGVIDYTPGSAVTSGDVIEQGGRALIARRDIAPNALGTLCTEGVFDVPKATGAVTAGDAIYWDNNGNPNSGTAGSGAATTTAGGNTALGQAIADATSGATYVRVNLQPAASSTSVPVFSPEAVAATGSDQSDAAAIGASTGFVHGTSADGTKGIKLPAATAGKTIIIKNSDAANAVLKVYPATGDAINAIAANSPISMAAKTSAVFVALDTTTWYTIPLLPS